MEDILQEIASLKKSQLELLEKLRNEEAVLTDRLSKITGMITEIEGGGTPVKRKYTAKAKGTVKAGKKTKRTMSPEAKAKIAAAQKKRWAAFHAKKKK